MTDALDLLGLALLVAAAATVSITLCLGVAGAGSLLVSWSLTKRKRGRR